MNNKEAIKCLQKRLNEHAHYFNKIAGCEITDDYYKQNVINYRLALLYAIKALRAIDNTADVLYICDHKSCKKGITYGADACDPCKHTFNVNHAANFEKLNDNDGRILAYVEHAQKENPQGDLISREALKEVFNGYHSDIGSQPKFTLGACLQLIDNAPTIKPKLSDKQIEEITDLLENEWGYEGMREDVTRILRGAE